MSPSKKGRQKFLQLSILDTQFLNPGLDAGQLPSGGPEIHSLLPPGYRDVNITVPHSAHEQLQRNIDGKLIYNALWLSHACGHATWKRSINPFMPRGLHDKCRLEL